GAVEDAEVGHGGPAAGDVAVGEREDAGVADEECHTGLAVELRMGGSEVGGYVVASAFILTQRGRANPGLRPGLPAGAASRLREEENGEGGGRPWSPHPCLLPRERGLEG